MTFFFFFFFFGALEPSMRAPIPLSYPSRRVRLRFLNRSKVFTTFFFFFSLFPFFFFPRLELSMRALIPLSCPSGPVRLWFLNRSEVLMTLFVFFFDLSDSICLHLMIPSARAITSFISTSGVFTKVLCIFVPGMTPS
ncbi:unnamed protein product [Prunus brigantina]